MQCSLPARGYASDNLSVVSKAPTFRELIEAAAKPYRELWRGDGTLNLAALRRHYADRGHPLSDASLSRIFSDKQRPGADAIEATHLVFRIPRSILRGEPVSAEMEKTLTDFKLSTLLLAQKIEALPKDDYYVVMQHIERALETHERLQEALKTSPNVTLIERRKR